MNEQTIVMLVIAPHPDDAEFGIAGMVAGLALQGQEVAYVIVTNGEKGSQDPAVKADTLIRVRQEEQLAAASLLGVKEVRFLNFPDGALEDVYELRLAISREIRRYKPRVVATTDPYRRYIWHRDHRITGQVVADAVYPFARNYPAFPELVSEGFLPHTVREVLFWGSEEVNYHVDITNTFDIKLRALKCHNTQVGEETMHDIEGRLRSRATEMAVGQPFSLAEAFHRVEILW